ncbi:MAG: class I SAM-dependent methyltransferase [Flammeovirgaceae bacterium]|nr:class I SAM-dependent methyltransferase [Flammeovirgaceae bacterium]
MDITNPEIQLYSEQYTSKESELLKQINRDTHAHVLMPRMLSGHLQGRLLSMLSCMAKPKQILEIGTYTGYSAICLAEGLTPDGKLITIDINDELEERVRKYFEASGKTNQIDYLIGDAAKIIPALPGLFDLVFIDADKENYPTYYDLIFNRVPLQGIIIADNVLWSGKVLQEKPDKDTLAIIEFNKKVASDNRVEQVLLPVRDGLMVIRKIRE